VKPLATPTIEEIERYKEIKARPERVLPTVDDPLCVDGKYSYGIPYPRSEEETNDLEKIKTNYDLLFIKDDVFNQEQIEIFDNHEWTHTQHGSYNYLIPPSGVDGEQFINNVKIAAKTVPNVPLMDFLIFDTIQAVRELDPNAQFTYFHGIWYTVQNKIHVGDQIHRDFHRIMAGWTCLYHLAGTSGETLFFDDYIPDPNKKPSKVVDFKQGRRILFPGYYSHRADIPVPGDTRAIAVVRFQIKTVLNEQIFAKTPGLENKYDLNNINQ
jgi:hypothetical protein